MSNPVATLSAHNLKKRYKARTVVEDVSFEVKSGEVVGLLGPNGAGKSTLIGQLGGEVRPDSGCIEFMGQDISSLPPNKRALAGLARSYQITSVFTEFTVLQNVTLAMQAHRGHSFGFWTPMLKQRDLVDPALRAIEQAGLAHRAQSLVSELAHGERRQLEMAMVLVAEPKLLLLDEPMAGMSHQESGKVVELLRSLKGRYTVLLVEHDMDAVFSLADRISVLVYGRIIACGTPAEISANPEVRTAYLGDEDMAA